MDVVLGIKMEILHISDLHLGKQVHGFSMKEEQTDLINKLLQVMDEKNIDLLLIAGDIFDRSIPSEWAIDLFDFFLKEIAERKITACIIAGNHDSSIRLKFGDWFLEEHEIYLYAQYDGTVHKHVFQDGEQKVEVFMLPFIKKAYVNQTDELELTSDQDAVAHALSKTHIDPGAFSLLMAHQFVIGSKTCDSELKSVGGSDAIDPSLFKEFDYVALGHLHSPQFVNEKIVYSGSPLKYSIDEIEQEKRAILLHVHDQTFEIEKIKIEPLRELIEIRGTYDILVSRTFYQTLDREAYYSIVLEDKQDVPGAMSKLQVIYPRIMKLRYADRAAQTLASHSIEEIEKIDPTDLISSFYKAQNGQAMSKEQKDWVLAMWEACL